MHDPSEWTRGIGSEAAKTFLKELMPQVLRQLRKVWPMKRRRLLRRLPATLRDCVADLRVCFTPRGPASFLHVISNLGLSQSDEWRYVNDSLTMAGMWFDGWDGMQKAVGDHATPEFFVGSLESLNHLLFWTSHAGEGLSALVDQTPKGDRIRKPMQGLVETYNHFLVKYEGFLRRLPAELSVRGMRIAPDMEPFFVRLRNP